MPQLPLEPTAELASNVEFDAGARRLIVDALNENLFVEAGAGTGKTRAIVDRIVALVGDGVTVERIAAITFTDRAAAELRERVRQGLEQVVKGSHDANGLAQAALQSLDRAQISTIHSFCQSIVRVYAAEAGVDPDFDVQDELMTKRRMQERWRLFLEELGDDPQTRADVDRLLSLGLRVDELERLALELADRGYAADLLSAQPMVGQPTWPDVAAMAEQLRSLPIDGANPDDKLYARAVGVRSLIEALLAVDEAERFEVLAGGAPAIDPEKSKKGYAKGWGGEHVRQRVFDAVESIAGELNNFLTTARAAALSTAMPRIVEFVRLDAKARGREGKLTFADLILRARRLLADSPETVAALRGRYDVLLIDEFQDTDPMQVAIAMAFATDPATQTIDRGRLFLVGDPKQSIYRFRRADMATYARTRAAMVASDARLPQLRQNRRSQRAVIEWVNETFRRLIGRIDDREVQPEYVPIELGRDVIPNGPGVETFGEKRDASARETRIGEAEDVAAICREAIAEEWQVAEQSSGNLRNAIYRDIAILLPRRTGLTALERALASASIPYRVEGGSLIYRTQEVRDLINILTSIDNPADEIATVAALRSPAFACSDLDLARHRARGGRFDYERVDFVTPGDVVIEGMRTLCGFHRVRHDASLAALVERVVLACGLIETGILDQGDRNSFRRARFMVERARAFEAGGPESLRAFVQWLEQQSDAAMLDNEGGGLDDDEDAVRILTIHGAKGLEFPIVILAGTAAQLNNNIPPVYTTDFIGSRVAVCAGAKGQNRRFILGDFDTLNALEQEHASAEFDRMLYVAATRARDHLLVSLHHHRYSRDSAAQRLIDAGVGGTAHRELVRAAAGQRTSQLYTMKVELPAGITPENFDGQRAALLSRAKQIVYTSATALAPGDEKKDESTDESEPWARGRGGTRLGRAVHATIQSLPLDADDATIAAFSRAQAVAEAIPHREPEVVRLVHWVVRESSAWQRARSARRAMREVPFALEANGKVLEGFVDLVIQTEDGIEIVDWKTDQISAADVPERLQKYELQAGLYVHGLESATGIKVRAVTYVFAHAKVESQPGEPGILANIAREHLEQGSISTKDL